MKFTYKTRKLKVIGNNIAYPQGYMPIKRRNERKIIRQGVNYHGPYDGNGLSSEVIIKQYDNNQIKISTPRLTPDNGLHFVSVLLTPRQLQGVIYGLQ